MAVAEQLKDVLKTYEEHKEELLGKGEGKWVLIHDSDVAGIWDTYEDALKSGYDQFGLKTFLVKRIEGIERVLHFSRDISAT